MKPQLTLVSPESCELLYTLTQTFEGRKAKVAESLRTFQARQLGLITLIIHGMHAIRYICGMDSCPRDLLINACKRHMALQPE